MGLLSGTMSNVLDCTVIWDTCRLQRAMCRIVRSYGTHVRHTEQRVGLYGHMGLMSVTESNVLDCTVIWDSCQAH